MLTFCDKKGNLFFQPTSWKGKDFKSPSVCNESVV